METLYRTESYSGSHVRGIRDIIEYEMAELRNADIPRYVLGRYALSDGLRKDLEDILALEEFLEEVHKFLEAHIVQIDIFFSDRLLSRNFANISRLHLDGFGIFGCNRFKIFTHCIKT